MLVKFNHSKWREIFPIPCTRIFRVWRRLTGCAAWACWCAVHCERRDTSKLEPCHYNWRSDLFFSSFDASFDCNVEAAWRNFNYFKVTRRFFIKQYRRIKIPLTLHSFSIMWMPCNIYFVLYTIYKQYPNIFNIVNNKIIYKIIK